MGQQLDPRAAVQTLLAHLEKAPADDDARLQLARLYLHGQQPADALAILSVFQGEKGALLKCLALAALGKTNGALAVAESAASQTDEPLLMHSLAYWLNQHSRWPLAISLLRSALVLQAENAGLHHDLAIALQASGERAQALHHFEIAIELDPSNPYLAFNLALALEQAGQLEQARDRIKIVRHLLPEHLGALYREGYLNRLLCQWDGIDNYRSTLSAQFERHIAAGGGEMISPYGLNIHGVDMALHDRAATYYASQIDGQCAQSRDHKSRSHNSPRQTVRPRDRSRIRLGYLSPDFHSHAVGGLISGLFACHDRSRFEVSAYSLAECADEIHDEIAAGVDRYVDLSASGFDQAAETIINDEIDILIDLGGYTRGARPHIPALRPAPMQISFLGYLNTMRAPFIDALIADDVVVPRDEEPIYSEKIIRLPRCFLPATPRAVPPSPGRRDLGLPDDAFVFCSFNHSYKIDPHCFSLWAKILSGAPGSVLWLLGDRAEIRRNLIARAGEEGIDPTRLLFADRVPLADHLARMQSADLFLDTPGYNAGATAIAAAQAGLPVMTLRGQRILGRMGASLNQHLGLDELIAENDDEYVSRSVAMAQSPQAIRECRSRLVSNFEKSFSLAGYCRDLEKGLLDCWDEVGRRK